MNKASEYPCFPGLQDKLAVVTGSTGGIGLGIAKNLVASGCTVVINGRSMESCNKACDDICDYTKVEKSKTIPVPGDLSSSEGVKEFLTEMEEALKPKGLSNKDINVLVNNVGIFETKDFFEITDEEWEKYHQINLMSGIRLSRALMPNMIEKKNGRIIFVASEAGLRTLPHMIPYSVSKAAQIAAARGLAEITKGIPNVTVNSLLPGPTWTGGVENYMKGFAESKKLSLEDAIKAYFEEYEPNSLLQRFLDVREVASAAAFLCSEFASGINGSTQRVEGGIIKHI